MLANHTGRGKQSDDGTREREREREREKVPTIEIKSAVAGYRKLP